MADITLKHDKEYGKTAVPNCFIDSYMIHANGEYVKVFLYLLRCIDDPCVKFSVSDFADKFEHTEKDIIRALKYWEKQKLLRLEFNQDKELTGICFLDASLSVLKTPSDIRDEEPAEMAEEVVPETPKPVKPVVKNVVENEDYEDLSDVLYAAERYTGKPLSDTAVRNIIYWHDTLGFSNDLIDYLVASCVDAGHKTAKYMQAVAMAWYSEGVETVEDAKQRSLSRTESVTAVKKAFGIRGRDLAPVETDYIELWTKEYGFTAELLKNACERTIKVTHEPSFEYADRILKSWMEQGAYTTEAVEVLDRKFKERKVVAASATKSTPKITNKFNDFPQRSYDSAAIERELLAYGSDRQAK